jgi:hypothetical protein
MSGIHIELEVNGTSQKCDENRTRNMNAVEIVRLSIDSV